MGFTFKFVKKCIISDDYERNYVYTGKLMKFFNIFFYKFINKKNEAAKN